MRSRAGSVNAVGVGVLALALLAWVAWTSRQVPDLLVLRPVERVPLGPGLDGSGLSRAPRHVSRGTGRIRGLMHVAGRPVVANVVLTRLQPGWWAITEVLRDRLHAEDGEERVDRRASSAEDGTFVFEGLGPGGWQVSARSTAGGYGAGVALLTSLEPEQTLEVELLPATHTLEELPRPHL